MNLFHYFFGSDKQRAGFIFDFIAPFYGKIDHAIQEDYQIICKSLNAEIPLKDLSILDIGTGTGAWLSSLSKYGNPNTVGVDFSIKMINQARKKHPEIEFIHADGEHLDTFSDNSFDIVTASFVLHGMKEKERAMVLKEMQRVAKKYVMVHDFHKKTALFVRVLEFLERSDNIHFKKNFKTELASNFEQIKLIEADNGNAIYVGFVE